MKYSRSFERDFRWFIKMRHLMNFDGKTEYREVVFDKNGMSGKEAFYRFDSEGKINATKHPNLLKSLFRTKGSVNLHIKMYAEDLAEFRWNKIEMRALCIKFKAPTWFRTAIENLRWKIVFENNQTPEK